CARSGPYWDKAPAWFAYW
nr:immunoglobulin heavy chain junction region [Mus musculus]NSM04823.1 immunoglobulin heavy chain junction region [Mus musculus]NSM06973.1 immunoglobulin heavy chain junction region [Mus musculus]NSM07418.1 immunoglobulin heavy chain junction region [Mus musculus]NSM08856.1 immunoglobulin heavy chain junction region [Mus musculus]